MNREIKFRQFCSDEDTVDYGMHYLDFYRNTPILDGGWDTMQYTGLKDPKGVEIWEGDIVQLEQTYEPEDSERIEGKAKVIFVDGAFRLDFLFMLLNKAIAEGTGNWRIEVLGNQFENPELLKN